MQIHILIVDIIEEAKEAIVITIVVATGMQDCETIEMNSIESGMFMRDIIKKMVQKEKNVTYNNKFFFSMWKKRSLVTYLQYGQTISRPILYIQEEKKKN